MARYRLTIAYDGSGFRGLAPNDGVRTVVGELQVVLEAILGPIEEIHMSGRTDAGVHAREQVLSFDTESAVDEQRVMKSINSRLGHEVVATDLRAVDPRFHARFSAMGRGYRYTILNHRHPMPFSAGTEWWVKDPLDLDAMNEGCRHLLGEHDFSSFCRRPKQGDRDEPHSLVRRIDAAHWRQRVDDAGHRRLVFHIAGPAFCHQMVRSIVGMCVSVGHAKQSPDDVRRVLTARDRNAAPSPAPPHGLMLWQVTYDESTAPDHV
ncbi:MAG: tRNA pseudouridine(38-40) synthase TruA [Acidimicrobiales bacterium]|nr:tRNA pseudouridine(38-40) synthase TruA [Acidimicrobiales bacterium]